MITMTLIYLQWRSDDYNPVLLTPFSLHTQSPARDAVGRNWKVGRVTFTTRPWPRPLLRLTGVTCERTDGQPKARSRSFNKFVSPVSQHRRRVAVPTVVVMALCIDRSIVVVCIWIVYSTPSSILLWASALCIRLYNNPAPVIRSMQFHYCTVSNPGTGADDAFVLKRCVLRNATWPSHSRPAIAAGARQFQICFLP